MMLIPPNPTKNKQREELCLLNYNELIHFWRKGTRNGNWRRLGTIDRVFYRAAMSYAKIRNKIINNKIITQLRSVFEKLENTIRNRIMGIGIERAKVILSKFGGNGVFNWAPQLKSWLKEKNYVFWLGLNSQPSNIGLTV
jgi:hypothetical protein